MSPKKIGKLISSTRCWWCGSSDLTGEHKFKATDLTKIYGKGKAFEQQGVSIIDYRSGKPPKRLQSAKSVHVQFDKSLCAECNNSRSQPFDQTYDRFIDYYIKKEELIKEQECLDFEKIFETNWILDKENLHRYLMKHVGCRLAEIGLKPFNSTIKYLDGHRENKHLKVLIQIKPYNILDLPTLYKGPIIPISHFNDKTIVSAVCGWFTVKNITFNYLYEWKILRKSDHPSSIVPIEIVDYSDLEGESFSIDPDNFARDYGHLLEKVEYFQYSASDDPELSFYQYIRDKYIS